MRVALELVLTLVVAVVSAALLRHVIPTTVIASIQPVAGVVFPVLTIGFLFVAMMGRRKSRNARR